MSTLRIKDLHVSVETAEGPKEILKGVNLTINSGEIHAIMGPKRLRQVHHGLRSGRSPRLRDHLGVRHGSTTSSSPR